MKILLVTGRLAEPIVRDVVAKTKTKHQVEVLALPVQVISLLSTREIGLALKRLGVKTGDYDLVIVPGLCRGSCKELEEMIGVKCVKGTIHANDLPLILRMDDPGEKLSLDKPADQVIGEEMLRENIKLLKEIEEKSRVSGIEVSKTYIPVDPPPFRIVSEITGSYRYGLGELRRRIEYLIDNGADIVSLGFEPYNPRPDTVYSIVRWFKRNYEVPVAIDTLTPSEIRAGVEAGVDLVLSIDLCNVDKVLEYVRDTVVVAIPYDSCRGELPRKHSVRVELLSKLIDKLVGKGVEKIVGDLILDPPITGRVLDSLIAYREIKKRYPDKPLMMGIGNVTELFDVDSHGLNALLTLLGLEAGVSMLLCVEESVKARGSTRELVIASQMITLAYARGSPPKDLGLDLLVLKDKRRYYPPFETENVEIVNATGTEIPIAIDRMGVFKIRVNHEEGLIEALYIGKKGRRLIKAERADDVVNYILKNKLVSSLSHAFYLGRELGKAEEALRIGKNYVQDQPLFKTKEYIRFEQRSMNTT